MTIGITNDHYGVQKKKQIKEFLEKKGYQVIDYGYNGSENEKVDYPTYAKALAINKDKYDIGIFVCTSGVGMSIAANRFKGIRCVRAFNVKDAKISRIHNHANAIAISGKYSFHKIKKMILAFINTNYDTTERYERRAQMLDEM